MTTHLKWLAGGLAALGLLAGTGAGVYLSAEPPKKDAPPAAKKPADPPAAVTAAAAPGANKVAAAGRIVTDETRKTMDVLDEPVRIEAELNAIPVRDILDQLSKEHGVEFRCDVEAYKAAGEADIRDKKPPIKSRTDGMTVRDLIRAMLGEQAGENATEVGIEVRGRQIVVAPSKSKSHSAFANPFDRSVTTLVEGKPLTEVLVALRRQTGATIVLDERARTQAEKPVSGAFNDTRLLTVLKVLGDMCELVPVEIDSVFYLTTRENAGRFPPGK